jgi:hypothetical protein
MYPSGLFSTASGILDIVAAARYASVEEPMLLTVLVALLIIGIDCLAYAFFHHLYGDKRNTLARQLAALKGINSAFPRR